MESIVARDQTSLVFEDIKDKDETIFWVGKPNALVFMASGLPFLAFGLAWGAFDLQFFSGVTHGGSFLVPFLLVHAAPCWLSILYMLWLLLAHNRTFYGCSNRRLLIKTGAIGTDIKTYDYDSISNLEVTVGPVEGMLGVGSIRFNTGQVVNGSNGSRSVTSSFRGIAEPYGVFKKIKQTAMDTKTDEYYPNAERPAENPGYATRYTPRN